MRPLTIDDILDGRYPADAQISPDGQQVAFALDDPPKSQIWMVSGQGGDARPFTTGPGVDKRPRWSPDGQSLAFLSDRLNDDKKLELFLISRHGGEAHRLFEARNSIGGRGTGEVLAWSPDGSRIAFLMDDPETEEEQKIDPILFERDPKFTRVWVADTRSGDTRCVTGEPIQVWEFSWSADGSRFALLVSDEPYEWSWYRARLAIAPAAAGRISTLYDPVPRQVALPRWSPDGTQIAFLQSVLSDKGTVGGDLQLISPEGGSPRTLSEGYPASISWAAWTPDGQRLIALASESYGSVVEEWQVDSGEHRRLWSGPVAFGPPNWSAFSHDRAMRAFAFAREAVLEPRQVWIARREDDSLAWSCLTDLVPERSEIQPVEFQEVKWSSVDGLEIHGYLMLPYDYQPGQRYPLLTWVHGGPTSAHRARPWGALSHALPLTQGMAVFLPNPRGSTGRGLAFAEANVGDMGGMDFQDIMAGIDALVEQGVADPERLAIGGWSYGGYMTAWAVTQTDRFCAAVMGASITNWLSFHGTSDIADWDQYHYRADPYERDSTFERYSPMSYVSRVRTPTLIIHGECDRIVPVGQSYEFFRALKQHGVPAELRVYPREPHGFTEKAHQRDWISYAMDWLRKYLG